MHRHLLMQDFSRLIKDYDFILSESLEKQISDAMYLQDLCEETLWNTYDGILTVAGMHGLPFANFTQEHRDAFFRLKMMAVDKRLRA